jgi:hypothetical protein
MTGVEAKRGKVVKRNPKNAGVNSRYINPYIWKVILEMAIWIVPLYASKNMIIMTMALTNAKTKKG